MYYTSAIESFFIVPNRLVLTFTLPSFRVVRDMDSCFWCVTKAYLKLVDTKFIPNLMLNTFLFMTHQINCIK